MKWLLILSLFIVGFKAPHTPPAFRSGDCVLFIDQPGKMDRTMIVRVEGFVNGRYIYRWWLFQFEWSVEVGKVLVRQEMFERLFRITTCPDALI